MAENQLEQLMQRFAQEYEQLSKQLKTIARFITENRQQMVVIRIRELADACAVQPSAVVRFAQFFGFSGFAELQALFRDAYAKSAPVANYQQRIRAVIDKHPSKMKSSELARSFMETCRSGIASISAALDETAFEEAVRILYEAKHIYVMGVRRMFPVANYLGYLLLQTRKRVIMVDALGSMYKAQIDSLGKGDVLLAVSMQPYGEETLYCTDLAEEREAMIVAITDSALSPIARAASAALVVQEAEAYHFRSMACTMSLAQALFIALAYRLELALDSRPSKKSRKK